MERYPYEASIMQKKEVKAPMPSPKYVFLKELKDQLEPSQAIQLVVPRNELGGLGGAWRRMCKGLDPHTFSRERDDEHFTVYLWLGPIEEAAS